MKGILAAVLLLLATVEGHPFWGKWSELFRPPGHSVLPPQQSVQPPGPPFPFPGLGPGIYNQQNWYPGPQQPGVDLSNVDWVCTNLKTRNMIIINGANGPQTVINGQTLPNGGCTSTNCKEQKPNIANPQTAAPVPTYDPTRVDTGEGTIDIRMGVK